MKMIREKNKIIFEFSDSNECNICSKNIVRKNQNKEHLDYGIKYYTDRLDRFGELYLTEFAFKCEVDLFGDKNKLCQHCFLSLRNSAKKEINTFSNEKNVQLFLLNWLTKQVDKISKKNSIFKH